MARIEKVAPRRRRSATSLLGETSLATGIVRLAPTMLLVLGVSWLGYPARATDFSVANEAQLRSAISSASNGDTITFTSNIILSSNLPTVTQSVGFNGGGFTLSGDNKYRGLFVQSGIVEISNLTITNAKAQGGQGGSGSGGGGGGGGAGLGGALFVSTGAVVNIQNVNFQNSSAQGGVGGAGGSGSPLFSGGGGGYWPTGANGGNASGVSSGAGGSGNGGDGHANQNGGDGGFGGGGGGSGRIGGSGGFGGGGGGGTSTGSQAAGGFLGGQGGLVSGGGGASGSGGGAGLGGAIFVQQGGLLSLAGSFSVSGNSVAAGAGGSGAGAGASGGSAGSGLFLQGNGFISLTANGQTQIVSDAIVDQTGVGGSGVNAGRWSVAVAGSGKTILTGANAYSGGTSVGGGGTLQGNSTSLRGDVLNDAKVVFDQAFDGTYAGNMSGTGVLTKSGSGALTLSGTNTHSGGTEINSGTLLFSTDANLGAAGKAISLNNSTIGVASGDGGQNINRPITITDLGAIYVSGNVTNPVTWSGAISGPGMLVVDGGGTLILSGANTYSGGTKVSSSTLLFNSDNNHLGAPGTGITLSGGMIGTTKDAVPGFVMTRPLTLVGSGGIVVEGFPLIWAGSIGGEGQFTKKGAGVLQLIGTNTYTGGTVVAQGTLQVASDDKLGAAGTRVTLVSNGILRTTGSFTTARPFTLANPGGTFQVDPGTALTLTGIIDGPGFPTLVGGGTLVLAGIGTYNGININAGTVQTNTTSISGNIFFDTNPSNQNARSITFDQATDGTYAGLITGTGSLTKTGAGKLILAGSNSYTAGTTISAGILQGTTAGLQGAITNNAALIFDQNYDDTYAGNMTGAGTLTKNGTGKINLSGISSVGGGTTINAGGLAINGQLVSNVTVNKGGSLYGSGHVKGDIINNGGTVKPGNSIGHLTVDGNFTFNSGTYEVEVNAQGNSDRVSVVGAGHKVMINAGTLQIVPEAGTYTPNTTYTIITTQDGGTVTFDTVTGGVGFLTPKVSLDREHIYVTLALAPNAFRSAGQTVNQQAVGGALDAVAASGNVGGLIAAMANLPTSQGSAALQAMSGQPYADFGTVNIQASQLFMNAVGRQMAVNRGVGIGGTQSVALAEACTVACDAGGTEVSPRLSAWLSGIGSTGSVSGDSNAAGLTYTLGGAVFGIDYRLDPRFLLGIAGGYVGGQQWVNGFAGNGYTDALSVALYGSFTPNGPGGGFYADALAGYANASNRLQRVVAIPGLPTGIASGSTSASQFLGQIETGYKFGLGQPGNTSITPFGRLQIGSSTQAAFTESGSSLFNLSVAQQTTTSVRTTFGADFGARFDLGGGTPLDIGLRLGWMHEFADTARPMAASFAAAPGPQFTVWGATPQRDSAVVGFSAATALNQRTSLFLSYDGELGGGTNNHQLRAGFRLIW